MTRTPSIALVLAGLASIAPTQTACEGSGTAAYLTTTPAIVGGQLVMNMGSPAAPNGIGLLLWGNDAGPSIPFCLDTSQFFVSLLAVFDAAGNAQFHLGVASNLFPFTLHAKALVLENVTWSLSKTVRVSAEYADSWHEVPAMAQARSLHTATAIERNAADNQTGVIVIGGATGNLIAPTALATTERFDAITRTWSAGPTMSVARCQHAVARTINNNLLVTGGMTNAPGSTGGPATAQCELYVPPANVFVPFAAMTQARMGHAMTALPNGRFFVAGGFADWTNAGPNFVADLNTARNTTEIYDPVAGAWAAGPQMASARAGHTQTLLPNGKILICGGVNGGQSILAGGFQLIYVPTFTASCELYDPATNTLTSTNPLGLARGFHQASLLPSGDVLVTGGAASIGFYGEGQATNDCTVFHPATNSWTSTAALPTAVAFHTQTQDQNGNAILVGGFIGNFASLQGTAQVVRHDGVTATALALIATHPSLVQPALAIGTHAAARMHDGTLLVTGGFELALFTSGQPTARSLLYIAP
ncbi:MAG TPA: kelch repeat-containing protein [Planctomycetota bacterium]|nr:kelch repeat-containing protein [Planctomycetota bacterium]